MPPARSKTGVDGLLHSPALAVLVAFGLRMSLLWWIHRDRDAHVYLFFPTSYENWNVAWSMVLGDGFSGAILGAHGPTAVVAPLYPWLIALSLKISHLDDYRAKVLCLSVNCLAAALTCWPIYGIGKKIGNHKIGLASSWLWVFLPTAIMFPLEWLWDTSFSAFFVALLIYWTLSLPAVRSAPIWIGYGGVWSITVLTNPAVGILFPFFLLWLALRRRGNHMPWIPQTAATVLFLLLGLAPWTIRNYSAFGKFVPVRSSFGLDLWLGNNPSVKSNWSPGRHPVGDPGEMQQLLQLGEVRYMQLKQHEAVEFIEANPGIFARSALDRFVDTWTGLGDLASDRWLMALRVGRPYVWVMSAFSLLAVGGLYLIWEKFGWEAAPIWMASVLFPMTYYVTHSSLRHRHPIDPVLTVFAVYALAQVRSLALRRATAQDASTALKS